MTAARPGTRVALWLALALLFAVLPVTVVIAVQTAAGLRTEQARIEAGLSEAAARLAQSTKAELDSSFDALTVLSQSELFQQGRIAGLARLLYGRPRPDWESIFLMDRDGTVLLDTGTPRAANDVRQHLREVHARVLQDQAAVVWGGGGRSQRGVSLALPIRQANSVRFVLGARISETLWQRLAREAELPPGARAAIFDAEGHLLGLSGADALPGGAMLPADGALAVASAPSGVHRGSDISGGPVYAAWMRVPLANWPVRVSLPAAPVDAARRDTIVRTLVTLGGSLLAGLALAGAVAATIVRRIRRDAQSREAAYRETLSRVAHDLRNAAGAIGAAADVLEISDPGSATAAEAREIIMRRSRELAQALHDLRATSKDEHGAGP